MRTKSTNLMPDDTHIQEFLDMIAPSIIKFNTDHFICSNTYRCVWVLREYSKDDQEELSAAKALV